jgi:nicotinate dehydrogenase subunit B
VTAEAEASAPDPQRLGSWFDVSLDGTIILKTGKVELGQGILLALRQIVAEELDLPLPAVRVLSGDTGLSPFELGTVGSMSIETSGAQFRRKAAELNDVLTGAAAMRLQAPRSALSSTEGIFYFDGNITNETFWTVAVDVDFDAPLIGLGSAKSPEQYKIVGTSPRDDTLLDKLTGSAFIHDIAFDGMLHGRILRKPHINAKLNSVDLEPVRSMDGVVHVHHKGDLVGVVATDEFRLSVAMTKLERRCKWSMTAVDDPSQTVLEILDRSASNDTVLREDQADFTADDQWLEATYSKPLVGHGSIGPSCGIALVTPEGAEIWTHSQTVFALRDQIGRVLEKSAQAVRVRHHKAAGCYGHNGADDAAMDAVMLARELPGKAVRVQWTRKDELISEPLGSPMRVKVAAKLSDRKISAWRLVTRSGTHIQRPGWNGHVNLLAAADADPNFPLGPQTDLPFHNGGSKNAVTLYDVPQHVTYQFVPDLPFRLSALRSLGAFANVFGIESFMDELAEAAGADPVEFRLSHLSDLRARRIIERVAEMASWASSCPDGFGRGIGFARFKNTGTYCAVVALVEMTEQVELRGLWAAVDAGLAVNPEGIVAQIEGGMLQAASWTLKEEIPTNGSRLTAETWKDYPILSFAEVPDVRVEVISASEHESTGVGEASLGPTAGAIGNAAANALGVRMRTLPLTRNRVIEAMM